MLSEEHQDLITTLGFKESDEIHELHLGCSNHPNTCQCVRIDIQNHEVTFLVIQRNVSVNSITYTFNQLSEVTKHMSAIIGASSHLKEAS